MERGTWTAERLDDLARRMDAGFDRIDRDIRELRASIDRVHETIQQTTIRVGVTMMLGFATLFATILARGS